jgi:hypothetical protein
MHIYTAKPGSIQNSLWQNKTIGDNHHQVSIQISEYALLLGVSEGLGLINFQTLFKSKFFDWTGGEFFASACWPIRLGIYTQNLMTAVMNQCSKMRRSEVWCSGEDNLQAINSYARCFLSFLRIRSRLSGDR